MGEPRLMCAACDDAEVGIFSPLCAVCEAAIAAGIRRDCSHFWSAPDDSGTKWCAWCGDKTAEAAGE